MVCSIRELHASITTFEHLKILKTIFHVKVEYPMDALHLRRYLGLVFRFVYNQVRICKDVVFCRFALGKIIHTSAIFAFVLARIFT